MIQPTDKTKYCEHCNMYFSEWVQFCQFCGNKLKRIHREVVIK